MNAHPKVLSPNDAGRLLIDFPYVPPADLGFCRTDGRDRVPLIRHVGDLATNTNVVFRSVLMTLDGEPQLRCEAVDSSGPRVRFRLGPQAATWLKAVADAGCFAVHRSEGEAVTVPVDPTWSTWLHSILPALLANPAAKADPWKGAAV